MNTKSKKIKEQFYKEFTRPFFSKHAKRRTRRFKYALKPFLVWKFFEQALKEERSKVVEYIVDKADRFGMVDIKELEHLNSPKNK